MDKETIWKRTELVDRINDLTSRIMHPAWIRTLEDAKSKLEPLETATKEADAKVNGFMEQYQELTQSHMAPPPARKRGGIVQFQSTDGTLAGLGLRFSPFG